MRRDRARAALWLVTALVSVSCVLPKYSVVDALPGGGGGPGADGKPAEGGAGGGGSGGGAPTDGGVDAATDRGVDAAIDRGVDAATDRGADAGLATPVCGDRVCGAGETQADCCEDCGCPAGRYCFMSTCFQSTDSMIWSFDDNCADGRGIQFRLFDLDYHNVWPPDPGLAYQVGSGETDHLQSIPCVSFETICYGAVPSPDNGVIFWGVGLDGSHPPCAQCCWTCGFDDPAYILSCDPP